MGAKEFPSSVWQSVAVRAGRRARHWASRRQGIDPLSVCLLSRRIYILPTRAGLIFGMIVFAMLLGSMNYNNNMGFALTFLLAGVGIISIYHCHHNLAELIIRYQGVQPVFAGDPLEFQFGLENRSTKARWQILVGWNSQSGVCQDLEPQAAVSLVVPLDTTNRGRLVAPGIQLSTRFPLGLFRAWSWVNMDLSGLVYPQPANVYGAPMSNEDQHAYAGHDTGGEDDFFGLRDYRTGDPPKRIAWKVLARTGETMVTEYRGGVGDLVWIDWDSLPDAGTEARIAELTRLVLEAHRDNRSYGLKMPGVRIPPAQGAGHRHKCLECLALFEATPGQRETFG